MSAKTIILSAIEKGKSKCKEKIKFETIKKNLHDKIIQCGTNLKIYEEIEKPEFDYFYEISPNFFNTTIYNAASLTVITLCALLNDLGGLMYLRNYSEQNQKQIFTKDFFQEDCNDHNSRKIVEMPTIESTLAEFDKLNNDIVSQSLKKRLKKARNKFYAHCDIDAIAGKLNVENDLGIIMKDLYDALILSLKLLNILGVAYDRVLDCGSAINSNDVRNLLILKLNTK